MWSRIAAAGLILSLGACTSGGGAEPSEESPSAQASCSTDSPLKVVEQGWTWTAGDENLSEVSYAAIVENTSKSKTVSYNGTVDVEFLGADGGKLGGEDSPAGDTFDLTELGPGDTAAISGLGFVPEKPEKLDFAPTGACLIEADAVETPAFKVSKQEFALEGEELSVEFTVDSSASEKRDGRVVLVFRDPSGEIVGGGPYPGKSTKGVTAESMPTGESKQDVTVDVGGFLPEDADVDATEVFVSGIVA